MGIISWRMFRQLSLITLYVKWLNWKYSKLKKKSRAYYVGIFSIPQFRRQFSLLDRRKRWSERGEKNWSERVRPSSSFPSPSPSFPPPPHYPLPCRLQKCNIFFTFHPSPPSQRNLSFAFSRKDYAWIDYMHWVRSLLSTRGMLLWCSLEPRPNSRALASAGSVMAIVLSINRCLTRINQFDHRKQDWLVQKTSKEALLAGCPAPSLTQLT